MAFERYGLTVRPGHDGEATDPGKPLQYVIDDAGRWTMNCFSCHGGSVYGEPHPGSPNNRFALQTMTEELRATKSLLGKPPSRMDLGSLFVPLGTTHGTTNAVVFGMGLMARRDGQLNLLPPSFQQFVHHDMDAPPWWHFSKRPNLYIDGFAQKGHRGLMQFTLIPENGPEVFRQREEDFRDVYAYIESVQPPPYQESIDDDLAERGRAVFADHCARCHGTYGSGTFDSGRGDETHYPNLRIPIDDIGTDPVRLTALSVEGRRKYASSWFAHAGEDDVQETTVDPDGYVAPPLDGVWASAPYFHNGSVPTLWHVLHPDDRPVVWRRTEIGLDASRVGLTIEAYNAVPDAIGDVKTADDAALRRQFFDTRRFGKSAGGHRYPDDLTEPEKRAVLEYLKTL